MSYDHMAGAYASHRSVDVAALGELRRVGRVVGSSRVLEVGCGTGNYSIALHEATGAACCGLDRSRAMLAIARTRFPAVPLVLGAAEALPFAGGICDLVFFVDVVHHLDDLAMALAEAFRVVRPGCPVCVATEDEPGIRARVHARYFPEVVPVELARYPTMARLRATLEASGGLRVQERRTVSPLSVNDIRPYRDRAFSSLHRISREAHRRGLERMQRDLESGPIEGQLRHVLVWAKKRTFS